MPVTAKLSRQFYDRLGDEVANELVSWLNEADQSYRTEFRELFSAHFGTLRSEMREVETRLRSEMREFEVRLTARTDQLESRMEAKIEGLKSELLRWMFLFWVGTMGTMLAILKF